MALKSYTKKGYTYTESAKGSNKFQNIKAAPTPMGERERPTVSAVRKQSASAKATSAATATPVSTKAFSKGLADRQPMPKAKSSSGKPGESMMARAEAARPGGARQSTGPVSRKVTPVKSSGSTNPPGLERYKRYVEFGAASVDAAERKPVSDTYLKELERRVSAAGSPLGSLSRWLLRTGDKLTKRY